MFLVTINHTIPRTLEDFRVSHLLRKIAQDTTLYFLMIFTSHAVFEVSLLLVRVSASAARDKWVVESFSSQVCDFYRGCEYSAGRF